MISLILAAGLLSIILLIIVSQLDKTKHFALRLLFIASVLIIGLIISKGAIDDTKNCDLIINETSEVYVYGNYFDEYHWDGYNLTAPSQTDKQAFLFHKDIVNTYDTVCYNSTSSTTATTLYKIMSYLLLIFITYTVYYFIFYLNRRDVFHDYFCSFACFYFECVFCFINDFSLQTIKCFVFAFFDCEV